MRFSARVSSNLTPNRLSTALAGLKAQGRPILDLTVSNPTAVGLDYPDDLLAPLGVRQALGYASEPFGMLTARQAVSLDYARRGLQMPADRIALTASTSEAYSLLFKLLCDPADEVLIPRPSYPLFEHLTRLDAVRTVPYDLEYHGRWVLDRASLERASSSRTRAVLVVSPNNPTGSYVTGRELREIATICRAVGAALVCDEVFADYPLAADRAADAGHAPELDDVLGFNLGGLSKSVGLPQAKLAWIGVSGPESIVRMALQRLEIACDAYLSVSTSVQCATGELLDRGAVVRRQISERVRANLLFLVSRTAETPACRVLAPEAGWSAVVQVPSFVSEEELILELLTNDGVLVHPGYFFDFAAESFLVLSLLPMEDVFSEGVSRIMRHFDCTGAAA